VALGLALIDPVRQQMIVRRIVRVSGVDESTIRQVIQTQNVRQRRAYASQSASAMSEESMEQMPAGPANRKRRWTPAEFAFGCLLIEPKILTEFPKEARDIMDLRAYGSSPLRSAVESSALLYSAESQPPSVHRLISVIENVDTKSALASLIAEIEHITGGDAEAIVANWKDAYKRARIEWTEMGSLAQTGSASHLAGDIDAIKDLIEARRSQHEQLGGTALAIPRPAL